MLDRREGRQGDYVDVDGRLWIVATVVHREGAIDVYLSPVSEALERDLRRAYGEVGLTQAEERKLAPPGSTGWGHARKRWR